LLLAFATTCELFAHGGYVDYEFCWPQVYFPPNFGFAMCDHVGGGECVSQGCDDEKFGFWMDGMCDPSETKKCLFFSQSELKAYKWEEFCKYFSGSEVCLCGKRKMQPEVFEWQRADTCLDDDM